MRNRKLKLYQKGGRLYYMKGGKMHLYIPKHQGNNSSVGLSFRDKGLMSDAYDNTSKTMGDYNTYGDYGGGKYKKSFGEGVKSAASDSNVQKAAAGIASAGVAAIPGGMDSIKYSNQYTKAGREGSDQAFKDTRALHDTVAGAASGASPYIGLGMTHTNLTTKAQGERHKYNALGKLMDMTDPATAAQRAVTDKSTTFGESMWDATKGFIFPGFSFIPTFAEGKAQKLEEAGKHLQSEDDAMLARENDTVTGRYDNSGFYGKAGGEIPISEGNAEIEGGEVVFDKYGRMGNSKLASPNASTTLDSAYAERYAGDKHAQGGIVGSWPAKGEDGGKDGAYVFSEFLSARTGGKLRKSKKKGGGKVKKEPSMADVAAGPAKILERIEKNPGDTTINNEVVKGAAISKLEELEKEFETKKAIIRYMEDNGLTEKDRPSIVQLFQDEPEVFAEYYEKEVAPEDEVQPAKHGGTLLSKQGMAAIGDLQRIFQEGGMFTGDFAEEDKSEEVNEIGEEDVISEINPINPRIRRLNDKLDNKLVKEGTNINALTGDELVKDVLDDNLKSELITRGLTDSDLDKPMQSLLSNRVVADYLKEKRQTAEEQKQNLNNEATGDELQVVKKGGQMRRTRRLSRYQRRGTITPSQVYQKIRKGFQITSEEAGILAATGAAGRALANKHTANVKAWKAEGAGPMTFSGSDFTTAKVVPNLPPTRPLPQFRPQKDWSVQQDSTGMTPITPIAPLSVQGELGTTQGRGSLGGGMYSKPLDIIGTGARLAVPKDVFSPVRQEVTPTGDGQGWNIKPRQQGGPIPPGQEQQLPPGAESAQHMEQLMAAEQGAGQMQGPEGMPPEGMPPEGEGMVDETGAMVGAEGGADPAVMQQISAHPVFGQLQPQEQQMLAQVAQVDPAMFEQLMNMPPAQAEEVLPIIMQQLMGAGQGAPEGPPQGGEMPPEMMAAQGGAPQGMPMARRGGRFGQHARSFIPRGVLDKFNR